MEGIMCKDCYHCLKVRDGFPAQTRGVCLTRQRMVGLQDVPICSDFKSKVPQTPYIFTPPPGSVCKDCHHGLAVNDNINGEGRWVCVKFRRVLADGALVDCKAFEAKVPQTPYLGKPRTLSGHPLFTEEDLVEEIRLALKHVEELLKALEMQPAPRFREALNRYRFDLRPGSRQV